MPNKIIIVGGVAAGGSAAARLRRLDESAAITVYERGEHISFANCGLPYYVGGEIEDQDDLLLMTPNDMKRRFNLDVRVFHEVVAILPEQKKVRVRRLSDGSEFEDNYDSLILAPGAKPINPFSSSPLVHTLRDVGDALALREAAVAKGVKRAVVVGGGFIGLEMAENLSSAGIAVTLVEKAAHILPPFDYDMARILHRYIVSSGKAEILTNIGVKAVGDSSVTLEDGRELPAELVVLSIGVRPETSLAVSAGLKLGPTGGILVDGHMRTSAEGIYAAGDAVEVADFATGLPALIPLASPANRQGRIAAENICGMDTAYTSTQGTAILRFGELTAASVGASEERLKRAGIAYVRSYTHSFSHASYYPGAKQMSVKLLFTPDGYKILGAQLVGPEGVDKRADVLSAFQRMGAGVSDLAQFEPAYAPPFSSAKDAVNMAGMTAENIAAGLHKVFYWDEVEALSAAEEGFTLIDVRSPEEFANGTIPGAVNIPVDTLRKHLNELPRDRRVYVFCQIGFRGYLAHRILTQNGFDSRNLSGGYKTWSQVVK